MKKKKAFRYTQEHIEFLREGYKKMHERDLAAAFNKRFRLKKKRSAIRSVLRNYSILCGRPHGKRLITPKRLLTKEQDLFVRAAYKKHNYREVTDLLNKKFKTSFKYSQLKTYVHNNGIDSGRTGQFEKGHVNWNKGTKGICKPNSGSYKKGDIPVNERPIGSERICSKDGYILVKVEEWDHNFNRPTRWKAKHIDNWEKENGPIKPGHCIKFKDGDKLNIDPSNLMEISQALNLRLNKHGYNEAPAEIKPNILTLAKLELLTFSKQKHIKKKEESNG